MELTDDVMNQVLRDVSKNISKERKKREGIPVLSEIESSTDR